MGGAFSALSDDATAAMYNPAGSALAPSSTLLLGYSRGHMALAINQRDAEVLEPHGFSLAVGIPFRIASIPCGLSVALYLPDQFLARLYVLPPEQPRFLLLDNDPHRIVFNPTVSLMPLTWLAVGGGITFLADAAGDGVRFDLNAQGGEAAGDSALDVSLPTRVAPVLGIIVLPTKRLRLGLVWRGAIDLNIRIDAVSEVQFSGVLEGDSVISVRAVNTYTPHRLSLSAAYDVSPHTTFAVEATYLRWRDFRGDAVEIETRLDLTTAPPLVTVTIPRQLFHDVVVPRAGVEHHHRISHTLSSSWRAGAFYQASPVPEQTGFTSYADNDRLVFTLGLGLAVVGGQWVRPMSIDAGFQMHSLIPRSTLKDDLAGPTGDFSSSGYLVSGSLMWTVRL